MARLILTSAVLMAAVVLSLAFALTSPLLQWRQPIYIAGGFAGVVALALLLFQPVLIGGLLSGLSAMAARRAHRLVGGLLVAAIVAHVGGLWISSPPDIIDALLFRSPTPFAVWGVIAMWAAFAAALLAASRRRFRLAPRTWRMVHVALGMIIVAGSIVHALLIEGTMEPISKAVICVLLAGAALKVLADQRGR